MAKKSIEVEDGEIAISSSTGVMAIVPKEKVAWVKKKIQEGCHECIDAFVATLPKIGKDGKEGV